MFELANAAAGFLNAWVALKDAKLMRLAWSEFAYPESTRAALALLSPSDTASGRP